jgi:hypothetical protein
MYLETTYNICKWIKEDISYVFIYIFIKFMILLFENDILKYVRFYDVETLISVIISCNNVSFVLAGN